jgi:hypothetical protein
MKCQYMKYSNHRQRFLLASMTFHHSTIENLPNSNSCSHIFWINCWRVASNHNII